MAPHKPEPAAFVQSGDGISTLDLLRLFRKAGGTLAAQLALHGQLFRVEWAAERKRLLAMTLVLLLGFACLLCSLIATGGLVLTVFWNSHPIGALIAVLIAYATGLMLAWNRLKKLAALGENSFAATREELAADLNMLRNNL